jgi:hypothetical protein
MDTNGIAITSVKPISVAPSGGVAGSVVYDAGAWDGANAYDVGAIVFSGSPTALYYISLTLHTSATPPASDTTNWAPLGGGGGGGGNWSYRGNFAGSTAYAVNDVVFSISVPTNTYVCIIAYTSPATLGDPSTNPTNWRLFATTSTGNAGSSISATGSSVVCNPTTQGVDITATGQINLTTAGSMAVTVPFTLQTDGFQMITNTTSEWIMNNTPSAGIQNTIIADTNGFKIQSDAQTVFAPQNIDSAVSITPGGTVSSPATGAVMFDTKAFTIGNAYVLGAVCVDALGRSYVSLTGNQGASQPIADPTNWRPLAPFPVIGTWYNPQPQQLTSGNTSIVFDELADWSSSNIADYWSFNGAGVFSVLIAGVYRVELNITVQGNDGTWDALSNKQISIDVTPNVAGALPTQIITQSALMASGQQYSQSLSGLYSLLVGDVVSFRVTNAFTLSGGTNPPAVVGSVSGAPLRFLNSYFSAEFLKP